MKRKKPKWLRLSIVLSRPNHRMQVKTIVLAHSELGRWTTRHLEQGYVVTLTKVELTHDSQGANRDTTAPTQPRH